MMLCFAVATKMVVSLEKYLTLKSVKGQGQNVGALVTSSCIHVGMVQ